MASHPLPVPNKRAKFNRAQFLNLAPRLVKLLSPHKGPLSLGFIALILASSLNLLFPYLIRNYLNENIGKVLSQNLYQITFALIGLFILQGTFFFLRHYYLQIVGLKITTDLKSQILDKLLAHEINFFDTSKLGDLLSRLNSDTEVLQKGLSVNISVALRYGLQVIFGIALMLFLSIKLTLIIIAIIPLLAIFSISFSKKLKTASLKTQEFMGSASVAAEEALSAIRVVKLFNAETLESNRFSKLNKESLTFGDLRIWLAAAFSSSMVTLLHCSIAIVFLIGGISVSNDSLSIGDFTAFLLYCTIVAVSFGFLLNAWAEFVQSLGAAERIYEIIDGKIEASVYKSDNLISKDISNFNIGFNNVSFSYPSRPDLEVIQNLTFTVPENKTTAIVGPSGAGKSTIVSLIPRLYEPSQGEISLGGHNINSISLTQLRSLIAFVPQTPQLFSGTIRENICYGNPTASNDCINQIIKDSALEELISKLPQGLDTLIGDKGIQLSGGERQRVSIARALLINPRILILDEATSSLDSYNESLIQQALEKARINRTVIIIAHRLSTVKNADQVIVLKKGKLEQIGNHSELAKSEGLYKTLVEFQLAS